MCLIVFWTMYKLTPDVKTVFQIQQLLGKVADFSFCLRLEQGRLYPRFEVVINAITGNNDDCSVREKVAEDIMGATCVLECSEYLP